MSPFLLKITIHASKKLKKRKITRENLRKGLIQGATENHPSKLKKRKKIKVKKRTLEIIYIDILGGYLIVTAYWLGEN